MVLPEQIESAIRAGLPCEQVTVVGDGRHFQATVVSPAFAGLSRVRQHQLVYGALGSAMADELVHALALVTRTPEEENRG